MPAPPSYYRKGKAKEEEGSDEDEGEMPTADLDDIQKPKGLQNFADAPFGGLCQLYDALESAFRESQKKPGYKGNLIAKFFQRWRKVVGMDLYPLLRLLLPERDTRRRTYNLKEQKLAKAIVTALDLPPDSADARKLMNWKVPTKADEAAGEFATVAEKVIMSRSSVVTKYGKLSVDDVNNVLDEISKTVPTMGADGKKKMPSHIHAKLIKGCIARMTPKEMKWLIRIILRDLKAGVREKTILKQFHEDAVDVFNTCSDIKRVCWQLWDPASRVTRDNSTIVPNRTFIPMFCYRLKGGLADIVRLMKKGRPEVDPTKPLEDGAYSNDEFIIEEKLDGERIQLHKVGDQYKYWSRKAKEYTYLYGSGIGEGSLTPYIADLIHEDIQEVIIDGEMLVWDPNLVRYMPFGNLKTFAIPGHDEIGPNDPRPCFKVFDVLFVKSKNGHAISCLDMPLWRRKYLLASIFTPKKGVIELADCVRANSSDGIKTYLERIVAERGEGLVIKHPLSKYCLGARNETWIKVKPEYMDALGESIDAVVVGGYWGEGRRGGLLSSFLVGLRDEQPDGTTRFVSFAKVGSGLNRADYKWIGEKIGNKLQVIKKKNDLPDWFFTRAEMPDVLISPEDSFVLEIKAAEIVGGADYGADMTLRFPRAMKIRDDKNFEDCADLKAVQEMRKTTKKRDLVGENFTQKKKARTGVRSSKATAVAPDLADVEVTTEIFAGLTVFVWVQGKKEMIDVQNKVREHGAKLIQAVPQASYSDRLVIAQQMNGMLKAKSGIKEVDVVNPSWVLESIEKKCRQPLQKRFLVQATPATQASSDYLATEVKVKEEDTRFETIDDSWKDEDEQDDDVEMDEPTPSSTWQARGQPLQHDSDEDGAEPETEGEDSEEAGEELDDAEGDSEESDDIMLRLLSRARLETRSPTLEPDLWTGAFSPYVAYFDTSENAIKNELETSTFSSRDQKKSDESLLSAQSAFVKLGGNVTTDLLDPRLTHIIMSSNATERRLELHNRTKEPKLRRIVTQNWILESAKLGSVIDENRFTA